MNKKELIDRIERAKWAVRDDESPKHFQRWLDCFIASLLTEYEIGDIFEILEHIPEIK